MAVNTSLPKKNDKPQSNEPGCGPPRVLNAMLLVLSNWLAFSMLKLTTPRFPFAPWLMADRRSGDAVGQYHIEFWPAHVGMPVVVLSRKKMPLEPLSMKLAG